MDIIPEMTLMITLKMSIYCSSQRLIEFKLTYDEFTEKTRKVCHYCGSMPKDRKLYKNIINE